MANEGTFSFSAEFSKGGETASFVHAGLQVTVSGTEYVRMNQLIGTSAEALDIGDITTPGYIMIRNRDTTNFVEIRDGAAGADVVKLKAGETALFRLTTTTPFAIADTAACRVEYLLIED